MNYLFLSVWTTARQNQQNDLCAQRILRSAWASAQSEQSLLSAWRKVGSLATHKVHSKDYDQTVRMPRLISVFIGRTRHFVGFVMLWLICISIYWFKHCNVSRSISFMKAFCRLLSHQTINYFFALNDFMVPLQISFQSHAKKFACMSFLNYSFLLVRYGYKASWDFLAASFWFCWLLFSFFLCITCSV